MTNWYDEVEKVIETEEQMDKVNIENARVLAFLDLIAWSEGTSTIKASDDGYNVIVGGDLFDDYSDHPRVLVDIPAYGVKSSAAGRYQILERYWDHYSKQLGLRDFSPKNQDAYAMNMFREVRAVDDIKEGRTEQAIRKCASRWASFPDAGYSQREVAMTEMLDKYNMLLSQYA